MVNILLIFCNVFVDYDGTCDRLKKLDVKDDGKLTKMKDEKFAFGSKDNGKFRKCFSNVFSKR